jgi:undecaprenyl-diphosphatase
MLEKIVQLDKQALIYLNGLGSEQWDGLWLVITKQIYWMPFFLVILYFLLKKIGFRINFFLVLFLLPIIFLLFYVIYKIITKAKDPFFVKKLYQLFSVLLTIALLIFFTDQITNIFKYGFERLRPCNDEEIKGIIRLVKKSSSFSFFSGHAANSMATMTFFFLYFKKTHFSYLLFLFPLIFAYSRIYLGLHFPTDILTGYAFGATSGYLAYKLYAKYILSTS